MKASTLVKTEEVVLIFDGDEPEEDRTLHLKVRPGVLTPAREAEIRAVDEDSASEPLVELMSELVIEWDMNDDNGVLIPLTREGLMNTPIIVLGLVMSGISEDFAARADEEGKISAAT